MAASSVVKRSRSSVRRCPRTHSTSTAPPVRKNADVRALKRRKNSRWSPLSRLADEAVTMPALEQVVPEGAPAAEVRPDVPVIGPDVLRRDEAPDVRIARFAHQLSHEAPACDTLGRRQRPAEV